jgi:hypothetical protein
MKKTARMLAVMCPCVVLTLTVPPTAATDVDAIALDPELILHYTFDDCDATDSSGMGNHGALMNSTGCAEGVIGNALEVRGHGTTGSLGDHVLLPTIDFMGMDEFAISLWIRDDGFTYFHGESYISFGTHLQGLLGISHFEANLVYSVGLDSLRVPWDSSDTGQFVLFGMTYQDGVLQAFKNGVLVAESEQEVAVNGDYAALARHWWSDGQMTSTRLNGALDDVRIYSRALTIDEMQRLYSMGASTEFADFGVPVLTLHFADADRTDDRYLVAGQFVLGEDHDGVDPANEDVTVAVGSSEIMIPAGLFIQHGSRYEYEGTINGVSVTARFEDLGSDMFEFRSQAEGMVLLVTANPVSVGLRVGNDFGKTSEHLRGWLSNQVTGVTPW